MDGPAENRIERNLAFDLAHTSVYRREGPVCISAVDKHSVWYHSITTLSVTSFFICYAHSSPNILFDAA
jgi:hypothetical protein